MLPQKTLTARCVCRFRPVKGGGVSNRFLGSKATFIATEMPIIFKLLDQYHC